MNPYYTANTIFVVLSMMIMLAAVSFNTTLDQQRKNITRVLFLVISSDVLLKYKFQIDRSRKNVETVSEEVSA